MSQPLHIKNVRVWNPEHNVQRDFYTTHVVVNKPAPGARVIDLEGSLIYPAWINAHDHLELNHYPRSAFRDVYNNAHEWGEEVNMRLEASPYKALRAYPLADRLFIGGLKNLLCGAATVAHHNPPHKALFTKQFPTRVIRHYGWSHSLHFNTDADVRASYRKTPKHTPWFIHLAEGTDEAAACEYKRLKALGCVGENTVIVHGVGMIEEDIEDASRRVRGLVSCPSTNKVLLGKTANIPAWQPKLVALGSDSRLTADGDLLDEMQAALRTGFWDDGSVVEAVTSRAAAILGLTDVGHLNVGARADWLVYQPGAKRAELGLVVKDGIPQIGDPALMAKFSHIPTTNALLDGKPKAIHAELARRIIKCSLKEAGLLVEPPPRRHMFFGLF